jgi:DNA invertase Pin-like site-specific DNA recombinase
VNSYQYVAYYRVSTGRQELGLSREAQREIVGSYVSGVSGKLAAEVSETISGRKNNRPELKKALWLCRSLRATLVIARLDRLSRNVEMIARLIETGTEFVAVDFPHANKFTIHILAAIAEYESRLMSDRMKSIIAASRARGDRLWIPKNPNPRFPPGCQAKSACARKARSEARARDLAPILWKAKAEGKSYRVIADEFNENGVRPPQARPWTGNSVLRVAKQTFAEFGPAKKRKRGPLTGLAQVKIRKRLHGVGALMLDLRRQGMPYKAISGEMNRLGHAAPRGGKWHRTSVSRYVMRAAKASEVGELGAADG